VTEAAASMSKTLRLLIMAGCFDDDGGLLLHDVTAVRRDPRQSARVLQARRRRRRGELRGRRNVHE
jgi:hypothetical protein